jgi:hypothetical protein
MRAGPANRKLLLTTHVVTSVGLLGAVAAFLGLAIAGLVSGARGPAVYPAMDMITTYVIVPLALVGLVVGVVQSLMTQWGLFRHCWVLIKLILTVIVVVVLMLQIENIRFLGTLPAEALVGEEMMTPRFSMVLHAGGGLLVLLVTTILSVYKPRGLTRYGWKRRQISGLDQQVLED